MTPDTASAPNTVASFRSKHPPASDPPPRDDATFEFASETKADDPPAPLPLVVKVRKRTILALGVILGVLSIAGAVLAWAMRAPTVPTGSLSIETEPSGAEVRIDDAVRGTTPLSLTLREGVHRVVVQRGSNAKQLNVEVASGETKAYHIAWAESAPAIPTAQTGSLSVTSDPPGSTVIVDGTTRGRTPLTVPDLSAGGHEVLVRSAGNTYQRSVQVEAGTTASLVVGGAPAQAAPWGWITLSTPFPMQVLEGGLVVGTSEVDRIMLAPGNHELDFVSEAFDFRQSSTINVLAGRGAPVSLTIPRVGMNINALPWAEVFIDGTRIGDTPLANVQQTIGVHEIVFRHPQFGERRQMTRVTLKDSPRISVDMRSR